MAGMSSHSDEDQLASLGDHGSETVAPDMDVDVQDDDGDSVAAVRYEITSFGVDFDVEGLCRCLERGEIVVPPFQRSFVWSLRHASRFIESLLFGLPVPGFSCHATRTSTWL